MPNLNPNSTMLWGAIFLVLSLFMGIRAIKDRAKYGWSGFISDIFGHFGAFRTPLYRTEAPSFLFPILFFLISMLMFFGK